MNRRCLGRLPSSIFSKFSLIWCSPAWHAGLHQIWLLYTLDRLILSVSAVSVVPGGSGTVAGGLNPLTISHPPMNTSHRPPGIEETRPRPDPMTSDTIPKKIMAYPTRPQMAKSLGTNFARYNV